MASANLAPCEHVARVRRHARSARLSLDELAEFSLGVAANGNGLENLKVELCLCVNSAGGISLQISGKNLGC